MAGRLKRIVDYVRERAVLKHLAVASLTLSVGEDVNGYTDETPDDWVKENKLREAAKKVLRTDVLEIR